MLCVGGEGLCVGLYVCKKGWKVFVRMEVLCGERKGVVCEGEGGCCVRGERGCFL